MNQQAINAAITAIASLCETTQLPEHYRNDMQVDYKHLMDGKVAQEFGYVLRTSGTHLDNPAYPLGSPRETDARAIRGRHKAFAGSNTIRYFWYEYGQWREVTMETYIALFGIARIDYLAQGVNR